MPAAVDGQPAGIRLVSWNLGHRTREKAIPLDFFRAVGALEPDVLVLNEFKDGPSRSELRHGLRSLGLPHILASAGRAGHNQVLVASRAPIETDGLAAPEAPDSHAQTNFMAVHHPTSGLTVVGMRAPAYAKHSGAQAYWNAIGQILRSSSRRRLVLVGDFNVDPQGAQAFPIFAQLTAHGWLLPRPTGAWSFVSGSKIDHVLASPTVWIGRCEYVCEAGGIVLACADPRARVSDHAALVAELRVGTRAAGEDAICVGTSSSTASRSQQLRETARAPAGE